MANRYWVGGTGVWSDASNHWSSTSGGSGAGGNLPTINDDVYFNAQSFDASGTITLDISANCNLLDFSSIDNSVWLLSPVQSAYIYGDLLLSNRLVWAFTSTARTNLLGTTNKNIDPSGAITGFNYLVFDASGTWTLQNDLFSNGLYFYVNAGTFNTNNYNMTIGLMRNFAAGATINLGSSIITFTWSNYMLIMQYPYTLNASTSHLIGSGIFQNDYGNVFNDVTINRHPSYARYITGNNTFNNLNVGYLNHVYNVLYLYGNQTTINKLSATNNSSARLLISSNTVGTYRNLLCNDLSISYIDFMDISAGGAVNWDISNIPGGSGDCGGNTGITFTTPASCYYVHTSGTCYWNDASKWFTESGGNIYIGRFALPQDTAIFDENSFSGTSTLVTNTSRIGNVYSQNINQSVNPYGSGSVYQLFTYGDLDYSGFTTNNGQLELYGRGNHYIKIANPDLLQNINMNLFSINGSYTLQSKFLITGYMQLYNGNFYSNGYDITTRYLYFGQNYKTLDLENSKITILGYASAITPINFPVYINLNAKNSTIEFIPQISGDFTFSMQGKTYNNIHIIKSPSDATLIIWGANAINKFIIDNGCKVKFIAGSTQTILNSFIASGTSDASIYIGSTTSSPFTLNASVGYTRMQVEHCFIQNSTASPNNRWYAQNSTDLGGNSGWNFKEYSLKPIRIGNTILNQFIEGPKYDYVTNNLILYYDINNPLSYIGVPYTNVARGVLNGAYVTVNKLNSSYMSNPYPEASIYSITTDISYPYTLIREQAVSNTKIINETVGFGNYRYSMFIKPDTSNLYTTRFAIDINDRNIQTVDMSVGLDWMEIKTTDISAFQSNNPTYQFFDINQGPANTPAKMYVSGFMIARNMLGPNDGSASLIPLNYYPSFIPEGTSTSHLSLRNLCGDVSIDVKNLSFDISTHKPWFNPVDDSINSYNYDSSGGIIIASLGNAYSSATEECWFKCYDISIRSGVIGYLSNYNVANYSYGTAGNIYVDNGTIKTSLITSSQSYRTITYSSLQQNNWYHVVSTKDMKNGLLKLYINGVKHGEISFDVSSYGYWAGAYIHTNNKFGIGLYNSNNNSGICNFFKGEIPVVRHYTDILTDEEILQNFYQNRSDFGL